MNSPFRPSRWWRNPHLQTIWPLLVKPKAVPLNRQRLELADGDFVDLDWLEGDLHSPSIVVILHGLEGNADSHYVRRMLRALYAHKQPAVVVHQRSCSGELNRLPRSYHSGETDDLSQVLDQIKQQHPHKQLHAVGYSLGGNVLCKYLGETGETSLIDAGVSISPPLDLAACAKRMERGFSRVYQHYLLKKLRRKTQQKLASNQAKDLPLTRDDCQQLRTFYQFDDKVTAPMHGFESAQDYYLKSSGKPFLQHARKPLLVIHSADDPFMTQAVVPEPRKLAPSVTFELSPFGGHVGFILGGPLWRPRFYIEQRVLKFFR